MILVPPGDGSTLSSFGTSSSKLIFSVDTVKSSSSSPGSSSAPWMGPASSPLMLGSCWGLWDLSIRPVSPLLDSSAALVSGSSTFSGNNGGLDLSPKALIKRKLTSHLSTSLEIKCQVFLFTFRSSIHPFHTVKQIFFNSSIYKWID